VLRVPFARERKSARSLPVYRRGGVDSDDGRLVVAEDREVDSVHAVEGVVNPEVLVVVLGTVKTLEFLGFHGRVGKSTCNVGEVTYRTFLFLFIILIIGRVF